VVVFRLFNTIGPRQTGEYGMVVPRFVRQALAGKPLSVYGDGEQTRCFCDVEDAVRALIGLAEEPRAVGQLFNIGSTEEISINALARLILQIIDEEGAAPSPSPEGPATSPAAGGPAPIRHIPYDEAYAGGFEDMRRRVPDIGRIGAAISWQPTISLRETLRKVVRFELERRGSDRVNRLAMATSHRRK
jgi:UDP-glucose 4-epimerase